MNKKISLVIACMALIGFLTGCAGPSRLEMDFGTSFKLAKFNQTNDLQAGKTQEAVTGMDGVAAKNVIEKYRKGFEKATAPATTYTFTIGSGAGTKQ